MSLVSEQRAIAHDLTSESFKREPIPTLARMREQGPVIRIRLPLLGEVWMATTYEAVNDLLRDHDRFVQNPDTAGHRGIGTFVRWLPRSLRPLAANMLLSDPPDHRRLRSLVEQAFRRQSVETLRPRMETLADGLLDHLEDEAARGSGVVDLLEHFARPFPLAIICEILGLPPEDRPRFTRWAMRFSTATNVLGIIRGLAMGIRPLLRYVREEFRRQSRSPRGGLMAALIEAEEAGDRLNEDELVVMVFLLLVAGHETTLHQITMSVLTLLDHPTELDALKADWRLADSAVHELLRFVSLAQISKPRYAREETEFHGQVIHRGQMIFACLAAANYDPSVFADPGQLDIQRHPNRHVAFGAGIHVCLGATLARIETAIALERLFTRFPHLEIAVPRSQLRFSRRLGARALLALPVRL